MRQVLSLLITATLIVVTGCSTVQDSIMQGATRGIGRAVTERAEQSLYTRLAPKTQLPQPKTPGWNQFMVLQAQVIFGYAFSAGGYWISANDLKLGEFTRFRITSGDDAPVTLERAFLRKLDNGNEWWRVSWDAEDGAWVYEALMSAGEERQVLRLRARDVDGNEGEIPVTEGTSVYNAPVRLTEESIQGASRGAERVTVPAGTYTAEHVVYMSMAGEGQVEWWITNDVPGGLVKYLLNDRNEGIVWTAELAGSGSNATSVLGSF